jgi:TonB family protein
VVAVVLLAGAPSAQAKGEPDFWGDIADPGRKRWAEALRRGRGSFDAAERVKVPHLRRRALEEALAAFREATRHGPSDAEGYLWEGRALYGLDRWRDAISAFIKARRLRPELAEDFTVAFDLSIAYTKIGAYEEAVAEHDRADRLLGAAHEPESTLRIRRATVLANAAEALMALGRLEEAVQRYQEALALEPRYVLATWGLAVAYDRDDQVGKAKEAVARSLAGDPSMQRLSDEGVFFIPTGDVHYYLALGHESRGDRAAARREWEAFVTTLPRSPWVSRAREHQAELEAGPRSGSRKKHLAPRPARMVTEGDGGTQDQVNVRYRVNSHLYRVRECYQKELRRKPSLAGSMRVGFVVSPEGRVAELKVLKGTVRHPPLEACVLGVIRGIYFGRPPSGQPVKVIYPLEFKPVP